MPTKVKVIQGNTMNQSHSLGPTSTSGYLSGLHMKVMTMKPRLCSPQLDFCLSLTSFKVKTGLTNGPRNTNSIKIKRKHILQVK